MSRVKPWLLVTSEPNVHNNPFFLQIDMEIDDDLFRRTANGAEQHMNLTEASESDLEQEERVLKPRSQRTPVRTTPNFPNALQLRDATFNLDPDVTTWSLVDHLEVGLLLTRPIPHDTPPKAHAQFFLLIWSELEKKVTYSSKHKEFRQFIYALQARAYAYDMDLKHLGLKEEALKRSCDIEPGSLRLGLKGLPLQLLELRWAKQTHNCQRLRVAREKDLAAFNAELYQTYNQLFGQLIDGQQVRFCLEGRAGTGKTYFLNTVIARCVTEQRLVLPLHATRGGLDTLLGGQLFPLYLCLAKYGLGNLNEHAMELTPSEERALAAVELIIIDGCQRLPAQHFILLDRLLRRVMGVDRFMGGKHLLMAADWSQPIDEARPSLRLLSRNTLFDEHMIKVKAEVNQRTQPYVSEAWQNFIMQTATHNGWIDPIPLEVKQIPFIQGVDHKQCGMTELINFVYNHMEWHIGSNEGNASYFYSRVILTRQATYAEVINNYIVSTLPASWFMKVAEATDSRPRMERSGRLVGPPFHLKLSPGMPLVLTQDLNPSRGLVRGTLVYFDQLSSHTMRVKRRLVEDGTFETLILPKTITKMRASENWDGFPSKTFERVQFPLRPAFAQTLTKAEGKTYERVGLLWSKEPTRVLHGELYLACSRVRHPKNLAICVPWHMEDLFKTPDEGDHYGLLMESLTEKPGLVNTVFHC